MDFNMKKIFYLLLVMTSFQFLNAQGNLQFNRVVESSNDVVVNSKNGGSSTNRGYTIIETINIPENKVWKVTSFSIMKYSEPYQAGIYVDIYDLEECVKCAAKMGGIAVFSHQTGGYTTNNKLFPIWFSSGDKELMVVAHDGGRFLVSFSAIEFNIIE